MKDVLYSILNTICPDNVYLQGTLNPEEPYPDSFITYWVNTTEDDEHFDNDVVAVDWNFSVMFYSNNPALINTKTDEIRTALKAAGFIPQGKGNDLISDKPTHDGWALEFVYKEIL